MKTIIAFLLFANVTLAQQPTPSLDANTSSPVPVNPPPSKPGLQLTDAERAAVVAAQITNTINQTFASLKTIMDSGVPAKDGEPAISAEEIRKAMGPENVKRIDLAQKALNGESK